MSRTRSISLRWLTFVGVAFVAISITVSGCDAGEPDAFAVRFENDLSQPVMLALCHSDHSAKCEHPYYRDHIAVGSSTEQNISTDFRTEWAVEDADGRLLRCVLLYWRHYPGHKEAVRLSTAPKWTWPCTRTTPARAEHG